MKKSNHNHRLALTAIAAVIASSTFVASTVPAAAQETDMPQTAPIQTVPGQTAPVEVPAQMQPVVPAITTPPQVSTVPVMTTPIMAPRKEVVQPLPLKVEVPAEEPKAEVVSQPSATTATKVPARKVTAKPTVKAHSVAAVAPHVETITPVAAIASVPATEVISAAAIVAGDAQIATETAGSAAETVMAEEATATSETPAEGGSVLPWALGLLGLGVVGGAVAMRRRKSEAAHYDESVTEQDYGAEAPVARKTAEPVHAAKVEAEPEITAPVAPVAIVAPALTTMSDRFRQTAAFADGVGYHESIVDDGPTPENPFQTRKARLKRARYLDRLAAENGTQPTVSAPAQASKSATTEASRTVTFGTKHKVDA